MPLPPTGTFTYAVNGSSTSAFGTQKVDGNSTLTVSSIRTGEERTKQQDQGGTTEQTLLARAGGLYLTDVHISQQGFDEDFRPNGSALLFPAHPTQGRQWSWSMTSTDGSYTLRGALTIADLHSTATTGDGSRVKTVSIATVLHIDGSSLHLVTHQRDEAAYDAMIIRERSVTDGTAYGTTIHSDATRVLSHRAS